MRCLRSGYCCVQSDVMIVDVDGHALRHKPHGVRCPHLTQDKDHVHSCAVHGEWWYPATPCASHGTIFGDARECMMGAGFRDTPELIPMTVDFVRDGAPQAKMENLEVVHDYGCQRSMEEEFREALKSRTTNQDDAKSVVN